MQIAVLGPLEVRSDAGEPIHIAGALLRGLLIQLAVAAPRPVTVATLADALWGDELPAEPANALQSLVSRLRRALERPDVVAQVPGGYRLMIGERDLDLHRFTALAREGQAGLRAGRYINAATALHEALSLWRGDTLDAAIERDAALTTRLHEQRLDVIADQVDADLALGRATDLVAELEQLVAAHPLREPLTRLLMRALQQAGRVPDALAAYERARSTLADELGIDPSPALAEAHLALLRGEPIERPAQVNPTPAQQPAPDAARNNLRVHLTSFVGRDDDVRRIGKLLGESRLVTLVGPGGAGKTRLATESVARLVDTYDDGVWLAELAPITDAADVAQVVLAAFGLRDSTLIERQPPAAAQDAMSRLVDAISGRECVLVLDNCEHLIDAAAHLADGLLGRCPRLRVLTTSREPLGVYGEVLIAVAPLGQPAPDADPAQALAFPATQLFADRAVAVRPSFVVDEVTVGPVVEIVRRLDGLPLAIELAAARLRTMAVEQIAARLTDRFRLLTGGSRTALPRHRTLHAVVEWSWGLLSEDERRLARRLAVFVGGITVASAAAVCASAELPEDTVEDLLASLVDKSLLQLIPDQSRYRMLETLREFGLERMVEVGEVAAIRAAHAQHFAALALHADPQLRTRDQLIWLAVINAERDNIVSALRYLADDGQAGAALDVAVAMNWYWVLMGRHTEAATWTSFALAAPGEMTQFQRLIGDSLVSVNTAASLWTGAPDEVEARVRAMVETNARLGDLATTQQMHPMVRVLRPVTAMFSDDRANIGRLIDEAMATGDPWTMASVRAFGAAMAENEGDTARAVVDAQTSLAEFRELGERWGMGNCLQILAPLTALAGDLAGAAVKYREALDLFATLGAHEDESLLRLRLADVLFRQGDLDGARGEVETAMRRNDSVQPSDSLFANDRESLFARLVLADIERQSGSMDAARRLRDEAMAQLAQLPEPHPLQGHITAIAETLSAKIDLADGEVAGATTRLHHGYRVGCGTKDMPVLANVGVGIAMLAADLGRLVVAAEILGAAAQLRGADDATAPDIVSLRSRLSAELGADSTELSYSAGRALARDAAIARLDPALFTD